MIDSTSIPNLVVNVKEDIKDTMEAEPMADSDLMNMTPVEIKKPNTHDCADRCLQKSNNFRERITAPVI